MKLRSVTISEYDRDQLQKALNFHFAMAHPLSALQWQAISNVLDAWDEAAQTEVDVDDTDWKQLTVSERRERETDP